MVNPKLLASDPITFACPLPTAVRAGDAPRALKTAVKRRERCTAHLALLDTERPTAVRCEYASQPTFILSSVES